MFKCFFYENVEVRTRVAIDWVDKILKSATEYLKKIAQLADNLIGQVLADFKRKYNIA